MPKHSSDRGFLIHLPGKLGHYTFLDFCPGLFWSSILLGKNTTGDGNGRFPPFNGRTFPLFTKEKKYFLLVMMAEDALASM